MSFCVELDQHSNMIPTFEILYEYLLYIKITTSRLLNMHKTHVFKGQSKKYIIFISGIFGGTSMYHLKRYARAHSLSYISIDFGFQLGDIDEYAKKLRQELEFHKISKEIVLVGYSMGG